MKWLGRLLAAVVYGAAVFGINALGVKFTRGVLPALPLLFGLWAAFGYFAGTMHHD